MRSLEQKVDSWMLSERNRHGTAKRLVTRLACVAIVVLCIGFALGVWTKTAHAHDRGAVSFSGSHAGTHRQAGERHRHFVDRAHVEAWLDATFGPAPPAPFGCQSAVEDQARALELARGEETRQKLRWLRDAGVRLVGCIRERYAPRNR